MNIGKQTAGGNIINISDNLLSMRLQKVVNGVIVIAMYMIEEDAKSRLLSLFVRTYRSFEYLQRITPEMWEDDGYLANAINIQK